MAAKVRERPKGSDVWWVMIDHQGRRKARKVGTGPKARKLAEDVARKIEAKLLLQEFDLADPDEVAAVFATYAALWIDDLPATCKPSTCTDYKGCLDKHITPVFGHRAVAGITRMDVKAFLAKKAKEGYSKDTLKRMRNVLAGPLSLAVDDRKIGENPAQRLGRGALLSTQEKKAIDALTPEELTLLLDTVRRHFPGDYALLLTLARTGVRRGEALALQWGDVDFNGRFIQVRRNYYRGKIQTPKNGTGRRVDMSKQLTEALRWHLTERKKEALRKGWGEVPEWLFTTEEGELISADHWRRKVYHKALRKAGLRSIRIHDLRHTYATHLIQNGASLVYIRDQLGHHSISITADTYGHLVPGDNRGQVDALDDATIRNPAATGL